MLVTARIREAQAVSDMLVDLSTTKRGEKA